MARTRKLNSVDPTDLVREVLEAGATHAVQCYGTSTGLFYAFMVVRLDGSDQTIALRVAECIDTADDSVRRFLDGERIPVTPLKGKGAKAPPSDTGPNGAHTPH